MKIGPFFDHPPVDPPQNQARPPPPRPHGPPQHLPRPQPFGPPQPFKPPQQPPQPPPKYPPQQPPPPPQPYIPPQQPPPPQPYIPPQQPPPPQPYIPPQQPPPPPQTFYPPPPPPPQIFIQSPQGPPPPSYEWIGQNFNKPPTTEASMKSEAHASAWVIVLFLLVVIIVFCCVRWTLLFGEDANIPGSSWVGLVKSMCSEIAGTISTDFEATRQVVSTRRKKVPKFNYTKLNNCPDFPGTLEIPIPNPGNQVTVCISQTEDDDDCCSSTAYFSEELAFQDRSKNAHKGKNKSKKSKKKGKDHRNTKSNKKKAKDVADEVVSDSTEFKDLSPYILSSDEEQEIQNRYDEKKLHSNKSTARIFRNKNKSDPTSYRKPEEKKKVRYSSPGAFDREPDKIIVDQQDEDTDSEEERRKKNEVYKKLIDQWKRDHMQHEKDGENL